MPRKAMSARRAARSRASSEKRKVGSPCFGGTVRAAAVIGWHPFTGVTLQALAGKPDCSTTLALLRPATSLNPAPFAHGRGEDANWPAALRSLATDRGLRQAEMTR